MTRIDRAARRRLALLAATWAAVLGAGCGDEQSVPPATSAPSAPPRAAVKLVVQVIGDEPLAEALTLLRGQWQARSGGDLVVEHAPLAAAFEAGRISGDVVVFPSRLVGELAERGELQPIRSSVLNSPEFAQADIYPAIRTGEMRYGDATLALPLGSPPLLVCRSGTSASSSGEWALPLQGNDAAHVLVARALAYISRDGRGDALFDANDMKPRIAEPPFERALREMLVDAAPRRGDEPLSFADGVASVASGEADRSYGWPNVAPAAAADRELEFERPASGDEVYAGPDAGWGEPMGAEAVTYLGVEGRLAAVTAHTRNAATAMRFCQWLTAGDVAVRASAASNATLWFRQTQIGRSSEWMKGLGSREGDELIARGVADALMSEAPFVVPRVPGIDEYLGVLADAVREAVSGTTPPQKALQAVSARWEEITNRRGREAQLRAYRRHLGVEAYSWR